MADKKEISLSLNKLVKSSIIVFVGLILSKLLTYVYRVVIARTYGPESYGVYSLALVCVGWFIAFATLGLSEGSLRYFVYYREKKQKESSKYLMKMSLTFLTISSILSAIILYIFSDNIAIGLFNSPELAYLLKWFSLGIPLSILVLPFVMLMRANENISAYTIIYSVVQNISKVFLVSVIILAGMSFETAIVGSYLASLLIVLIVAYLYIRIKVSEMLLAPKINKEDKKSIRQEVFRYSAPMLFYSILVSVLYWIDSMSLGYYKTPFEVGLYNAAVPIALLLSLAPELFSQLFYPLITKYYTLKKSEVVRQLVKQVSKWIFAINIPIGVMIILYPEVILSILFGNEYIGASRALQILALSNVYASVAFISTSFISASGRSKTVLINMLIASFVNVILNSLLVPKQYILGLDNSDGLIGAAIATLISITLLNTLFIIQTKKIIGAVPFRMKMISIMLSSIIPIFLLIKFSNKFSSGEHGLIFLILVSLSFALIYGINLIIFRAFDRYDIKIFRDIKSSLKRRING